MKMKKAMKMKKGSLLAAFFTLALSLTVILCFSSCAMEADVDSLAPEGGMLGDGIIGGDIDLELDGTVAEEGDGEYQRKIIKTASITAETKQFDESIDALEALCKSVGGYVESSSVRGSELEFDGSYSQRYASYIIRIPAESFDSFNDGIDSMLNVTYSTSNVDEITSTYYDIQSRIEVLELQKSSLETMYENFTDYKDIYTMLELQDKLYSVIEEIEAYKTQLRLYDGKVAYSTVKIDVTEVVEYTEEEKPFLIEIKDAFFGGLEVSLTLLEAAAIVIAAITPVLLPPAILLGIAALIVSLSVRAAIKRKKRKNESK